MKVALFLACLTVLVAVCYAEKKGGLQIGVKKRPETCEMRSKKGDKLSMHYTVSNSSKINVCLTVIFIPGNIGRWN